MAINYTFSGLTSNTTYYYSVQAVAAELSGYSTSNYSASSSTPTDMYISALSLTVGGDAITASNIKVGTAITATATLDAGGGASNTPHLTYQWQYGSGTSWTNIGNAITSTSLTQTTTPSCTHLGKYIRCVVTIDPSYYDTTVGSDPSGITATSAYTVRSNALTATISTDTAYSSTLAIPQVDATLSLTVLGCGGGDTTLNTDYTVIWYRGDTAGAATTAISGATNSSYTITCADRGYYLSAKVTGTGNYAGLTVATSTLKTTGVAVTTITAGAAPTGTFIAHSTLSALPANITNTGSCTLTLGTDYTIQWLAGTSNTAAGTAISGATSQTYTLTCSEVGDYISYTISPVAGKTYTDADSAAITSSISSSAVSEYTLPTPTSVTLSNLTVVGTTNPTYSADWSVSPSSTLYRTGLEFQYDIVNTYASANNATIGTHTSTYGYVGLAVTAGSTPTSTGGSLTGLATGKTFYFRGRVITGTLGGADDGCHANSSWQTGTAVSTLPALTSLEFSTTDMKVGNSISAYLYPSVAEDLNAATFTWYKKEIGNVTPGYGTQIGTGASYTIKCSDIDTDVSMGITCVAVADGTQYVGTVSTSSANAVYDSLSSVAINGYTTLITLGSNLTTSITTDSECLTDINSSSITSAVWWYATSSTATSGTQISTGSTTLTVPAAVSGTSLVGKFIGFTVTYRGSSGDCIKGNATAISSVPVTAISLAAPTVTLVTNSETESAFSITITAASTADNNNTASYNVRISPSSSYPAGTTTTVNIDNTDN